MPTYLLARNGQQQGEYSLNDLQRMVSEGSAMVTDLVWKEGMASWVPLLNVLPSPSMPPGSLPPPPLPAQVAYGYPPPAAAGTAYLMPPSMPWGLVLLCTILTLGIFYWVWIFRQSNFIRKLDPTDSSRLLLIIGLAGSIASNVGAVVAEGSQQGLSSLLQLAGTVSLIVAVFKMRTSMESYYNSVEPIGLKLSGVMTFFFSVLYFQHHFSRISRWKQTGFLEPQ